MFYTLIPNKERNLNNKCWFCGTTKSVKYQGKIRNPCFVSDTRYIDILICNKCALLHDNDI